MIPVGEKLLNVDRDQLSPFIMSSEAPRRKPLRIIIAISLLAIIGLGAGYYFASASASSNGTRLSWTQNPLFITFSPQAGSGSASDSFKCSNTVAPVTFKAFVSDPSVISLTVSPSSFSSCGSTADNVVLTATCTASALAQQRCQGDFLGIVLVFGPSSYQVVPGILFVIIHVTNGNNDDNTR